MFTKRPRFATIMGLVLMLLLVLPTVVSAEPAVFPNTISLPAGIAPEGIATGRGTTFFVGSLSSKGIYAGDLRTGKGDYLPGTAGRVYTGLKLDARSNYLFVAGAGSGRAYVYDARTGAEIAVLQLAAPDTSFINDVVLTRDAAYFTNSLEAAFYRLPLGPAGKVSRSATAQRIPLTGDWQQPDGLGANGIVSTPDGRYLIIVNTTLGTLYRVDPATGYAALINLNGASVVNGDGLLLEGKTLYVVQNRFNQIAVFELSPNLLSAQLVDTITNPAFVVPTTIARFGNALYAVNAKFGTPQTGTPYEVVRVER